MSWSDAIVSVVKALGVPYGFTITIWSTGALAIVKYGMPSTREVLLFAMGATMGYLIFDAVAWTAVRPDPQFTVTLPTVALLNIVPVIPALLVARIVRQVNNRPLGFLTVGFSASFIYIGVLAIGVLAIGVLAALLFGAGNLLY